MDKAHHTNGNDGPFWLPSRKYHPIQYASRPTHKEGTYASTNAIWE